MDIFLFIAAIISMLAIIAIIHIVCKHMKLKTLLAGIGFQPIKQTEAAAIKQIQQHCTMQWYRIAALTLMRVLFISISRLLSLSVCIFDKTGIAVKQSKIIIKIMTTFCWLPY